jgi:hypothetical protein
MPREIQVPREVRDVAASALREQHVLTTFDEAMRDALSQALAEIALVTAAEAWARDPAAVERGAQALWAENERWRRRNPDLSVEHIYPYERLIEETRADLRRYTTACLRAALLGDELDGRTDSQRGRNTDA